MNKCRICKIETKNKIYCSTKCQHEGYRQNKPAERIDCICKNCGLQFKIRKSGFIRGLGKFCSRKCVDEGHSKLWVGKNSPNYGKKHSVETKLKHSKITKNLWKSTEFRNKVIDSLKKFTEKNGYSFGWDDISIEKRNNTFLSKYGVNHNWKSKDNRKLCEKTCIKKYGKNSSSFMNEAITLDVIEKRRKTLIETITGMSYVKYLKLMPKKQKYYASVWRVTNKQPIKLLENYNKRGRAGQKGAYHLDHIIPIIYGFLNNIPPEIIGNISNLQIITWEENLNKSTKILNEKNKKNKN